MNFSNCVTKLWLNVTERVLPSKRRCFWTYQNIMCYKVTFWMSKHVTRTGFACIEMQCQDHILNVSKCVAKTAFLLTGFYLIFVALTSKQSYFTLVLFFSFHQKRKCVIRVRFAKLFESKAKQNNNRKTAAYMMCRFMFDRKNSFIIVAHKSVYFFALFSCSA